MYTAADSNQYMAVDLTGENGVAFLPSEARRIHTPPLPTDATSPGVGKARGFFFDYNAPSTLTVFPERPPDAAIANAAVSGNGNGSGGGGAPPRRDSDWYRVKMNAIEAEAMTREELAVSVPEHFPNSPLCPRHPKHKSGGTGECPYHGRNASVPKEKEKDTGSAQTTPSSERWW